MSLFVTSDAVKVYIFREDHKNMTKSSNFDTTKYLQINLEISSNFVAVSKYMNFIVVSAILA